jgi:DNA-binding Xre family transcriptional regulator
MTIDCGSRLCELQVDCGISSVELSKRLGVPPQQLVRWRQTENLKIHTIQRICEALSIKVSTFLEE